MSEEQNDKEFEAHLADLMAIKNVFDTEDGKSAMKYLKNIAHYNASTLSNDDKIDLSHWREGRRSLVLDLLHILDMDLGKYKKRRLAAEKAEDEWKIY